MVLPKDLVLPNGTLNEELILKTEKLYQGLNGRFVERFYLAPEESYIFKPLTNNQQIGKEAWVHENILPMFPAIFPKIIACSDDRAPEWSWMILEDLGPLSHVFNEECVFGVTRNMAWWHSLPCGHYQDAPLEGLKPRMEKIVAEVLGKQDQLLRILPGLCLKPEPILNVITLLDSFIFSKKQVLSHGDLHLGNYAIVGDRIVVLDWEHTHLNVPFWDLYHVIDMSHPSFPKKMTVALREQILDLYLDQVGYEVDRTVFKQEYYLFSAIFSIWMLLLIQNDLQGNRGKWPAEQLENQLCETAATLEQCAEALKKS